MNVSILIPFTFRERWSHYKFYYEIWQTHPSTRPWRVKNPRQRSESHFFLFNIFRLSVHSQFFMETTREPLHLENEVWYSQRSCSCMQVLFELLFSLTELLNVAKLRHSNFWGGWKTCTSQCGTIEFYMLIEL
jgi:hypothetical protein